MKAVQEFKEFAVKGNVVDMAVGVVIGAGFGKIVSSLVADIITPVLGVLVGGVNFTNLKVTLKDAIAEKPPVTWNYGSFIQSIFDFLIIAWAIFVLVKLINRLKRQAPKPAPAPPPTPSAQ
jgi:large conductance mechanosensitive channel